MQLGKGIYCLSHGWASVSIRMNALRSEQSDLQAQFHAVSTCSDRKRPATMRCGVTELASAHACRIKTFGRRRADQLCGKQQAGARISTGRTVELNLIQQ